jgi:hypothetical protein
MDRRAFLVPLAAAVAALMTSADGASSSPLVSRATRDVPEIRAEFAKDTDQPALVLHRSASATVVAQHSSHASHGSHSSHASHSSGRW